MNNEAVDKKFVPIYQRTKSKFQELRQNSWTVKNTFRNSRSKLVFKQDESEDDIRLTTTVGRLHLAEKITKCI